jgi:hypothetical protein
VTELCPICGAEVKVSDGAVHAYVPSSPGCWALFGEVQADEMTRFGYPTTHRMVVDAYLAQHPGDGSDRRDRQSVFLHLIGLCAVLERGSDSNRATDVLRRALEGRPDFPVLQRSKGPGALTITSMVGATDLADYEARARRFATAVWDSWRDQQPVIRAFLDKISKA